MLKLLRRIFLGEDLVDLDYIKGPYLGQPLEPSSDKMETTEQETVIENDPIVIPENPDVKVENIVLDENNNNVLDMTESIALCQQIIDKVIEEKEKTFSWIEWSYAETYNSVKDLKKKSRSSKKATV